jgi:hypothetical protein
MGTKIKATKEIQIHFKRENRNIPGVGEVTGTAFFVGHFAHSVIVGVGAMAGIGESVVNADREFCTAHKRELHAIMRCADEVLKQYGRDEA